MPRGESNHEGQKQNIIDKFEATGTISALEIIWQLLKHKLAFERVHVIDYIKL